MDKNVIIVNPKKLGEIKKGFYRDGVDKIHVLADFNKTLTRAFVNGEKRPSLISVLRDGDYLSPDYAKKAHTLYDKYNPIAIDPDISLEEKKKAMHEWWSAHYVLLKKSGLQKKDIDKVILSNKIKLRAGADEFFDFLRAHNIPLIIMSANGLGDESIKFYLQQEKKLYNNTHIISNMLEFDEKGYFIKAQEPIIHSMNKDETIIRNFPAAFNEIKNKKNIILLGDGLGDVDMIKGFDYKALIKIGFLNDNVDKNLKSFKDNYDVIILNDSSMGYVNNLLNKLIK